MNRIPPALVEQHKTGVESLRFYGVPVVELDRDELLAFANLCAVSLKESSERTLAVLKTMRALNVGSNTT